MNHSSTIQLVAALCLQCTWRGYCGRRKVLCLKSRLRQRETAAIRIQKWWYDINGQFATFLLMRVLGLQDQIELRNQIHKNKKMKLKALMLLQSYTRKWVMKRKEREVQYRNKCAFRIQKIWRGILTRRMFSAYILETRCAIIIQMFDIVVMGPSIIWGVFWLLESRRYGVGDLCST